MHFPKDTLAWYRERRLLTPHDMSLVSCQSVATAMNDAGYGDSPPRPETEALWFYLQNHAMAELQKDKDLNEPLGEDEMFAIAYLERNSKSAIRAFHYLMMICTREARYVNNKAAMEKKVSKLYGLEVGTFLRSLFGHNSSSVYTHFLHTVPDICLVDYVSALRYVFYEGSFNSSYGGPAWGKVTDCLYAFVVGKYSAEMMLDIVWTLAHNTSAIFNKGLMYTCHTTYLQCVLDIQRSGQVPEAVAYDEGVLTSFLTPELKEFAEAVVFRFPKSFGSYLDWYKVQALGAIGSYPAYQKIQVEKHGESNFVKDYEAKAKAYKKKKAVELEKKLAEEKVANFEVMPGLHVKKIKLDRVA